MKQFRPLLAADATDHLDKLRYPLLVSPKLDGIRAIVRNGKLVSRSLKPIPNKYIRTTVEQYSGWLEGFDGELIVGKSSGEGVFARTTSAVMSREGTPVFTFHVFDVVGEGPYHQRTTDAYGKSMLPEGDFLPSFVKLVPQLHAGGPDALAYAEKYYLKLGYEGIILRDGEALYKFGRSTLKEQILLKVKRFEDDEAVVVGFEEKMHNNNTKTKDERGYAKRSNKKEGLTGAGTLGALVCESERFTDVFNIGTGFDEVQRKHIWTHRAHFRGRLARFKFQRMGTKDAPRSPVFQGWRDTRDL